jgi:DNA-binding MarR family transcriptional regulator
MTARPAAKKASTPRPSLCSCVNLRRASRAITRIYDRALEPAQLKITQYSVLANVARFGPLNISKLARILKLDRTTLVRNLKSLELSCYIENVPVSDPRERAICITESGRSLVERAQPYWSLAQKQIEENLGAEGVLQLNALVTALENLSDEADLPEDI